MSLKKGMTVGDQLLMTLLCVHLVAADNWVLLLVASVTDVEVEIANKVSASRVHFLKALLELLVALTVKAREIVIVFESIFLFTCRHVVAMIVFSAAHVGVFGASQIIVLARRVAWSAPFSAGKAQINSLLSSLIAQNCVVPFDTIVVLKSRVNSQRVLPL
jgi:hypothetical protein